MKNDLAFTDPELAGLYDLFSPPANRADFGFYRPLIATASAVLDAGCGTGALLGIARDAGHTGRLVGLDPADAMLRQARTRADIEWVHGDLSTVDWNSEFDLAIMTGHAFQQLVTDEVLDTAFSAMARLLIPGGRFVFETRNPLVREWERWPEKYSGEVTDSDGVTVTSVCGVKAPANERTIRFTHTLSSPSWSVSRVSHGELRFLSIEELAVFIEAAGLEVGDQFGDWDRSPVSSSSPEIITEAVRPM